MYKKQTFFLILFFFTCCIVSAQTTKIDNEYYSSGKLKGTGTVQIHGTRAEHISDGLFDPGRIEERLYTSKIGEWKFYYESGQLESSGKYSDGKKNGEWKEYYESGELERTGNYANGDKVGKWKGYYESGQLKIIEDYSLNSISYIEYYENGNKYREFFFRTKDIKYGSKVDGPFIEYYENGNLKELRNFDDGTEVGMIKLYDENGNLEYEGDYDLVNGSKYLLEPDGKNYAKAKELLLKSAKRGNEQAEYYLGYMYHTGIGVSINHDLAIEWYTKSCDKKYYDACYNIGVLILSKEGAIVEEMNSLGTTEADNKRYDELANNRLEIYKEALPYIEKAYSIDSSKEDIKNTITKIKNALNN
tara:strand:+ start:5345 stop:6427 length:1083 start_codon:yes stop_codon:yes gene_type:complete